MYLCLLLLLNALALMVSCKLTITAPAVLENEYRFEDFKMSISSFGRVPYGYTIIGTLKVPYPPTACGKNVKVDYTATSSTPLIVLARRGDCTFLEKTINAQKLGASLLIIVNSGDDDIKYIVPISDTAVPPEVRVPSVLIEKTIGEKLIRDVQNHRTEPTLSERNVIMVASFEITKRVRPTVVFKFDLSDYELYQTIAGLETMFPTVKEMITLIPAFNIVHSATPKEETMYCLNGDDFCQMRIDRQKVNKEEDQPLLESIRQLCLVKNESALWWNYAKNFFDNCMVRESSQPTGNYVSTLKSCSDSALDAMPRKVEAQAAIADCMGAISQNTVASNSKLMTLLRDNHDLRAQVATPLNSSVMINGQILYGRVTTTDVLKEVCSSIETKPEACIEIAQKQEIVYRKEGAGAWWYLWFVVKLLLVGFIAIAAFYIIYKWRLAKDIGEQLSKQHQRGERGVADSVLSRYYEEQEQSERMRGGEPGDERGKRRQESGGRRGEEAGVGEEGDMSIMGHDK